MAVNGSVFSSRWFMSFRDSWHRLTSIFRSNSTDLTSESFQVANLITTNATGPVVTDTRISVVESTVGLMIYSMLNSSFPGALLDTLPSPVPVWQVDFLGLDTYELYYTL